VAAILRRLERSAKSLRVRDVYEQDGEVWVHVPDEARKAFGRSFNLHYSVAGCACRWERPGVADPCPRRYDLLPALQQLEGTPMDVSRLLRIAVSRDAQSRPLEST